MKDIHTAILAYRNTVSAAISSERSSVCHQDPVFIASDRDYLSFSSRSVIETKME